MPRPTVALLALVALASITHPGRDPFSGTPAQAQIAAEARPVPPAAAAAAGYNKRTFGPGLTIGGNWKKFSFYGMHPSAAKVEQNHDGSVTIYGGGNSYNAQIATAERTPTGQHWQGIAFGGGGYFEATLSFTGTVTTAGGWPSFWSHDIEGLAGDGSTQWKGQVKGYVNEIEVDFMEFDTGASSYGGGMHNWFGNVAGGEISTTANRPFVLPPGTDLAKPHRYGFFWVPATATTAGSVRFYFDGEHIRGWDKSWRQYNPALPPSPVDGTTAYSVLDARHLVLILGSGPKNPMTVIGLEVWQTSDADNLVRPANIKKQS